jgi:hypothetical protein
MLRIRNDKVEFLYVASRKVLMLMNHTWYMLNLLIDASYKNYTIVGILDTRWKQRVVDDPAAGRILNIHAPGLGRGHLPHKALAYL